MFSDKTGTLTCNSMVFKKMSVCGQVYGTNESECPDAAHKEVTNFNMHDPSLSKILADKDANSPLYQNAQRYLYHLALCHTIVTSKDPRDEQKIILNSSSPDELSLLNAAKYYGVKFIERNQYNEILIQDEDDVVEQSIVSARQRSIGNEGSRQSRPGSRGGG